MTRIIPFRHERRGPDPGRVAEFAAFCRRVDRERAEAPSLVDRILGETARGDLGSLGERSELLTLGTLDYFAGLVATALPADREYAQHLAMLAASIADSLEASEYPAIAVRRARTHAWMDVGKVRSASGQHVHALDAFKRAETILGDGLAHDLALVHVEVAATYLDMGRTVAAGTILTRCVEVLRDHGDDKNAGRAASLLRASATRLRR